MESSLLLGGNYILGQVILFPDSPAPSACAFSALASVRFVWRSTAALRNDIKSEKWAPYHDDSDWTIVLKFKDDIVPDGKYSAIMTAYQKNSKLRLYLKYVTTEGQTEYHLNMGAGVGFALSEDQFFSWVGGEPSKDGHHYLILAKHGDFYDIFYDGSIWQYYGAPIGEARSDATLQLFATDAGVGLMEKVSGTIEVLRVYDSALTRDECFKLYRELQTPW